MKSTDAIFDRNYARAMLVHICEARRDATFADVFVSLEKHVNIFRRGFFSYFIVHVQLILTVRSQFRDLGFASLQHDTTTQNLTYWQ